MSVRRVPRTKTSERLFLGVYFSVDTAFDPITYIAEDEEDSTVRTFAHCKKCTRDGAGVNAKILRVGMEQYGIGWRCQ